MFAVGLCLWSFCANSVSAAASPDPMVIFGNEARPPKIWRDGKEAKGALIEILRATERALGVRYEFRLLPWPRAQWEAEKGYGGITGFSKTTERLKEFDYSEPFFDDTVILVAKSGREFRFENDHDLKGKHLCVQRGASYGLAYEEVRKIFTAVDVAHPVSGLRMVLEGRADAMVISPGVAALREHLKDPTLAPHSGKFVVLSRPLTVSPNSLAFHKSMKMSAFLARFDALIRTESMREELARIRRRYE